MRTAEARVVKVKAFIHNPAKRGSLTRVATLEHEPSAYSVVLLA